MVRSLTPPVLHLADGVADGAGREPEICGLDGVGGGEGTDAPQA